MNKYDSDEYENENHFVNTLVVCTVLLHLSLANQFFFINVPLALFLFIMNENLYWER